MFHAHRIGTALGAIALAADALGDLRAGHIHGLQTKSGLHRHRSTDGDGDTRVALFFGPFALALLRQSEELAKSAHVEPGLVRQSGRIGKTELSAERFLCAITQALRVVVLSVVRLHEDFLPYLHQAVAQLTLQTDIRNLSVAVIIGAWPISIQRVAVGVGVLHAKHHSKVDLVLKRVH